MRFRRSPLHGVVIAAVVATLAGCAGGPTGQGDEPSELVLGYAGQAGLNPFAPGVTYLGNWPAQAAYDSFIRRDGVGFAPNLATEWHYDETRTVLTFTLREDVTFSDGAALDAEAVKANVERHLGSESVAANRLAKIERVEILDDFELAFHLTSPNPELLQFLGSWPIVGPSALDDTDALTEAPVGSGPYTLNQEESVDGVESVFDRRPDYWNEADFPYDRVVVKWLEDGTARVNALKSGQVDVASIDITAAAEIEAAGFPVVTYGGIWVGLSLGDKNGTINPALADVRVRQAIAMAFDREALVENLLLGFGEPSNQPFIEGQAAYLPDREDEYAYDPERARDLLAEAGYPDGFDLLMPPDPQYGPFVQQYLADIGINVIFDAVSDDEAFERMISGYYAALIVTDGVLPIIRNHVLPGAILNGWHYTDARIEALLTTWATGSDEEVAVAEHELGELLLDEAWFAIFAQVRATTAAVDGIRVEPDNASGTLWLWDISPAG